MPLMWKNLMEELGRTKRRRPIEDIVGDLLSTKAADSSGYFIDFIKFIYEASGNTPDIWRTSDFLDFDNSKNKIFNSMDDALRAKRIKTYPILKDSFLRRFSNFVNHFVIEIGRSFFSPDKKFIAEFLEKMMKSEHSSCRHTGTLAYLKIVTAGAQICEDLNEEIQSVQQQKSSSFGKTSDVSLRGPRLESLRRYFQFLKENVLHCMCKTLQERFRDVLAKIRLLCVEEAQLWCKNRLHLLGDTAFKHSLRSRLCDEQSKVREAAVQLLLNLFENLPEKSAIVQRLGEKLLVITYRQLKDIVENDSDNACLAIEVLSQGIRYYPNALSTSDQEELLKFIYWKENRVGYYAGSLWNVIIQSREKTTIERVRLLAKFSARKMLGGESCVFLGLENAECEWLLRSAESMMTLLIDSHGTYCLSADERRTLVVLFGFLVRWLATRNISVAKPPRQRLGTNLLLPLPLLGTNQPALTPLPAIMEKFPRVLAECARKDGETCVYLLRLVQFLSFDESRLEATLSQKFLSEWLQEAFRQAEDASVLDEISTAVSTLSRSDSTELFKNAICDISQFAVNNFATSMDSFLMTAEQQEGEKEIRSLSIALKRIAAVMIHHEIGLERDRIKNIHTVLKELTRSSDATTPDELEVMEYGLKVLHIHLTKQYRSIERDSPQLILLQEPADECIFIANTLVLTKESSVRERVYPWACDFFVDLLRVPKTTLKQFLTASKAVLEKDVFKMDGFGSSEAGYRIISKFVRVLKCGVVSVSVAPPVFQYYTKYRNDYGGILENLLETTKALTETQCAIAIVRSLDEFWDGLNDKSAQELAKELALLFGCPLISGTVSIFHESVLMVCLKRLSGQSREESRHFTFVEILSAFLPIMRSTSKQAISDYLNSKILDLNRVAAGNLNVRELISTYLRKVYIELAPTVIETSDIVSLTDEARFPPRKRTKRTLPHVGVT